MKKLIVLCFIIISSSLHAQNDSIKIPKKIFKISPQHFFVNTLHASLELIHKDKKSSTSITLSARTKGSDSERGYNGGALEIQYRKYLSALKVITSQKNSKIIQGIYLSSYISGGYYEGLQSSNNNNTIYIEKTTCISPGFTIGIQRSYLDKLYLDFYIGGGMRLATIERTSSQPISFYTLENSNNITSPGFKGVAPRLGFTIGVGLD